jgi:hypothetical protein
MTMRHSIVVPKMLLILAFSVGLSAQGRTIPERVAEGHAAGHPRGKPVELESWRDIEPLPLARLAAKAELAVVGRLTRLKSYLSADKVFMYTDYQLTPRQVIVDRAGRQTQSTPGAPPPLIVTFFGGELVVDGTPIRITDTSLTKWDENADVLVFLYRSENDPAKYELYGGPAALFQIDGTKQVRSLLKHGGKDEALGDNRQLDQIVQRVLAAKP